MHFEAKNVYSCTHYSFCTKRAVVGQYSSPDLYLPLKLLKSAFKVLDLKVTQMVR